MISRDFYDWAVFEFRRFDKKRLYAWVYSGYEALYTFHDFYDGVALACGPLDNRSV